MDIIPQEEEADARKLAQSLRNALEIKSPDETRVFLFGSWASYQKSFTGGDVDVFVGVSDYDYHSSTELATLLNSQITVTTKDGDTYENRPMELHWGDINDFLSETEEWERVELTKLISE